MKAPYIEKTLVEEDVTYSKEELDEIVREGEETLREAREGKLKGYKTDEELFRALGI